MPQNGERIVTIGSVTSLHTLYCSERVPTSNFPSATVLSLRESRSHRRRDSLVVSGVERALVTPLRTTRRPTRIGAHCIARRPVNPRHLAVSKRFMAVDMYAGPQQA